MEIKIIITTTDSDKTANDIAKYLLKDNLSPCVQITSNINSVYKWKDQLEKSEEILLLIKTIPENVENCKKLILKYHKRYFQIYILQQDLLLMVFLPM